MLTEVKGGMALGLGVQGSGGSLRFSHGDSNRGFRCFLLAYPARGDGVAVMTNGSRGDELMMEVVRGVAAGLDWPAPEPDTLRVAPLSPEALTKLAGTYEFRESSLRLTVVREGDHLVARTPRGSRYRLYPASDTVFIALENGAEARFTRTEAGGRALHVWGMVGRKSP